MTQDRRSSKKRIEQTEEIDITFGAFERAGFRVPFMSAVMTVQQIKDYFALVTDDAKYANQNWSLEELYQREIDWFRVTNIVKEYLGAGATRPAFFNSLTVVLMQDDKPAQGYSPPNASGQFTYNLPIGPIQINFERKQASHNFPASCSFGSVSWNRHEVKAVAIDGQHRLAALKDWKDDDANKTSISVLLLIIDKKIGFVAPKTAAKQIPLMRSIFIDLNKHAKPVSRARNLLLDDQDAHAIQLRCLISTNLDFLHQRPIRKNKWQLQIGTEHEFEKCIPLCTVDWHGEGKSKIESGPYLTSILALDWFIQKVACSGRGQRLGNLNFNDISIDDNDYYEKIEKAIKLWPKSKRLIENELETAKKNKQQYLFSSIALRSIRDEFTETWGPAFTRLLTQTSPYAKLLDIRIKYNSITPQFGQWYQAKDVLDSNSNRPRAVVKRYEEKFEEIESELRRESVPITDYESVLSDINSLKTGNVLFYLTGQRALLMAFGFLVDTQEAANWAPLIGKKIQSYKYSLNDFYAEYIVLALNSVDNSCLSKDGKSLFDRSIESHDASGILSDLSRAFWAGSVCDRTDPKKIDFNEAGAKRAAKLLILISHVHWFAKTNKSDKRKLRKDLIEGASLAGYTFGSEVEKALQNCLGKQGDPNYDFPLGFHIRKLENDEQSHYDALRAATLEFIFDRAI